MTRGSLKKKTNPSLDIQILTDAVHSLKDIVELIRFLSYFFVKKQRFLRVLCKGCASDGQLLRLIEFWMRDLERLRKACVFIPQMKLFFVDSV